MVGRESVRTEKIEFVEKIADDINKQNIVGIFDLHKMPAAALQKIKYELHGKADLKSIKKSLLLRAVEKSDKKQLKEHITGQPGLILTDMDPFKLYKIIQKSKSNVSAKPGDIALTDIQVSAGPTELMPGPAISTLSKVGIQSKVEGGKIAIVRDKVVAKAGQEISVDLASILGMLKIRPMEVGLDVKVVLEGGVIYTKDILAIDEQQILNDMINCYHHGINLSIESGFITNEAVPIMISKAFAEARTLCLEAGIISKDIIGELLSKAVNEMKALEDKVGDLKVEEPKEEVKEEVKKDGKESSAGKDNKE